MRCLGPRSRQRSAGHLGCSGGSPGLTGARRQCRQDLGHRGEPWLQDTPGLCFASRGRERDTLRARACESICRTRAGGCFSQVLAPGLRNLHLAELAAKTIEGNRMLYPNTNISLIAQLSTQVDLGTLGGKADILVTETFGTMLLGEGALTFLSDASTLSFV